MTETVVTMFNTEIGHHKDSVVSVDIDKSSVSLCFPSTQLNVNVLWFFFYNSPQFTEKTITILGTFSIIALEMVITLRVPLVGSIAAIKGNNCTILC